MRQYSFFPGINVLATAADPLSSGHPSRFIPMSDRALLKAIAKKKKNKNCKKLSMGHKQ